MSSELLSRLDLNCDSRRLKFPPCGFVAVVVVVVEEELAALIVTCLVSLLAGSVDSAMLTAVLNVCVHVLAMSQAGRDQKRVELSGSRRMLRR